MRLKAKEKRTVLVGLRITPEDATRLDQILEGLAGVETSSASSYAYRALLGAMERDERRLAGRGRKR